MLTDRELWEKCKKDGSITPEDLGLSNMRDATKEERESINNYIANISNSTDVDFFDTETVYKQYKLNLDKVNSFDDCKKILKFLCQLTIKPLPEGIVYGGFEEVSEYFS